MKALVEDANDVWPRGHNLVPLWQAVYPMAKDEDVETMFHCQWLFELLDGLHFSDRYSEDGKGIYAKAIDKVTLASFRELFVPVAGHLEFCARLWLHGVAMNSEP